MTHRAGSLIRRALARQAPYPYPGFDRLEIAAVDQALRIAWRELLAVQGERRINLTSAGELEISEHLAQVLDTLSGAKPAALPKAYIENFAVAHRETALTNYSARSISKQPDLTIQPRVQPRPGINARLRCLFVEAKIYDPTRTTANYVRSGLIRFINGDYAWAMPEGFMLAYVRDVVVEASTQLSSFFTRTNTAAEFLLVGNPARSPISRRQPRLIETVHNRSWPDAEFQPGNITVFHLWLNVGQE